MIRLDQPIREFDPIAADIIASIPSDLAQAQYSTHEQLVVLYEVARKMKLYDAREVIGRLVDDGT